MNLINYAAWISKELKIRIYLVRKRKDWDVITTVPYNINEPRLYSREQSIEVDEEGFFKDPAIIRWFAYKDSTDLQYMITPGLIIRFQLTGELP